jgi:hypothetical protein
MKRASPGCTSAKVTPGTGGRQKRAKTTPEALQCKKVENALTEADIPAGALEALLGIVPHALLVPKDERHLFQEQALDMVANILSLIEAGKEKAIPTKEAEREAANAAKAANEIAVEKTKAEVESTQKACKDSKLSLAEVAMTFQQAKAALKEAQSKLESSNKGACEATSKRGLLEAFLQEIPGFQSRPADTLEIKELTEKITAHMEIDSSLVSAASHALATAPDARGVFDVKVIKELEDKATQQMAELTELVQKEAQAKAAIEAEVQAAEAALEVAKVHQLSSAHAYDKAADMAIASDEAFKAAKKALSDSSRAMKKTAEDANTAQALYEIFRDGALQDFQSLRERVAPAPVAEASTELEEIDMPMEEVSADAPVTTCEMPQPVAVAA